MTQDYQNDFAARARSSNTTSAANTICLVERTDGSH